MMRPLHHCHCCALAPCTLTRPPYHVQPPLPPIPAGDLKSVTAIEASTVSPTCGSGVINHIVDITWGCAAATSPQSDIYP